VPRTRLHPLLSATTEVALPRDHDRGREEVGFAGRGDEYKNNNNNNNNNNKTARTIPNNKPDIINRDNEKGTCMLIDVAISGDRNVIKKKPRRF